MEGLLTRGLAAATVAAVAMTGCSREPAELPGEQIVVVGDSYTMGPNDSGDDPDVWPAMVWQDLRARGDQIDPTVSGEGGAGYVHPGYKDGVFADKAKVIRRSTDLMVFFGSANDIDAPVDEVPGAVRSTLEQAKDDAPGAKLLVIGPAWPYPEPPPEVWQLRDVVRDAATALGATIVDPLEQRWLWDDPSLIGPDKIHPNRAGQEYLAGKIGPLIQAELPTPQTP